MRSRPVAAAVVTATAVALSSSVLAAPTGVTVDEATRTGTTVTAAGTATFDGDVPVTSVGGTPTKFAHADLAKAVGIDLVDATIGPLPDGEGLRFTWHLSSLPAQVPPEGVRYTWSFAIGEATFQLQAKRTNLGSVTTAEDPAGHVTQAASSGYFQLRGNCTTQYMGTPISGCYHLGFLDGAFDVTEGTVTMDVPFGLEAAPAIAPGAVLVESQSANMSIAASLQAVVSTAGVSDFINGWKPYYAGPSVGIATGSATAAPAALSYRPVELDGEAWSGSLKSTLSHTTLYVRACEGASESCIYQTAPLG